MIDLELVVRKTFASVFNSEVLPSLEISMEGHPEWDSVNHLSLIVAIEDELDVIFSDDETVEAVSLCKILIILKEKAI